jgi:multidrug efflux pump subunit AcrB
MVKFLLNKPIAVTMTFIAIMVLGIFSLTKIPVSLMPDIAIPEITVQVSSNNTPARELEGSIVRQLRQQLMQVSHLDDINSETIDGSSTIRLRFSYGTNIDYAFIEVNEKIDRAMTYLPRDIQRPKVIKANVSDVPVFYLNLTLKNPQSLSSNSEASNTSEASIKRERSEHQTRSNAEPQTVSAANDQTRSNAEHQTVSAANDQQFIELSRFASNVIRKRLEQLPEVAMVDMSGLTKTELLVVPDLDKLSALGIGLENLENLIRNNNVRLGNLSIHDGQYVFNVRFATVILNKHDLEEMYLKVDSRVLQLKNLATVVEQPRKLKGRVISNGQEAITLAVIKQHDAQMNRLKNSLHELVLHFESDYPDIQFEITRDQTQLLDYSITNLKQSLLWGALLAFLVMFVFLRDFKSPMLVGITIPLSLIVSLLFFHLIGLSINTISLSGLILGVGMMIDNSIIVIDNITQHFERYSKLQVWLRRSPLRSDSGSKLTSEQPSTYNLNRRSTEHSVVKPEMRSEAELNLKLLMKSCITGTNEVIRPLLTAVLTTCAVFIPLIFIDGIAGSLFYDQAMAVTIGLFASLAVSITILPVYYLLFYSRGNRFGSNKYLGMLNRINYEHLYEKGFRFTMRSQKTVWTIIFLLFIASVLMYRELPKSKLPLMDKDEMLMNIDWNAPVHVEENSRRSLLLLEHMRNFVENSMCLVGEQQFLLDKDNSVNSSSVSIYIKTKKPAYLDSVKNAAEKYLHEVWPAAKHTFNDADNIFNVIFSDNEAPLLARLRATNDYGGLYNNYLEEAHAGLSIATGTPLQPIVWQQHTVLSASAEKLLLYDVDYNALYRKMRSLFSENEVILITDNNDFIPVVLGGRPTTIDEILQTAAINNNKGEEIPVRELLSRGSGRDLKIIRAGNEGEYFPVEIPLIGKNTEQIMDNIRQSTRNNKHFEVSFTGSIFSNREMINSMLIILLISLALLYFILASQFESLKLPLIVLFEVPIAIFGVFAFLMIFGGGINIMSLIGIVVSCGIIINDSILKIDTINQLLNSGYSLMRALIVAGQRRLKPILMTSITTILALCPFLFVHGLGADLQRPLALAVIGGMLVGTFVSLFFIPLCYYYLKRKVV